MRLIQKTPRRSGVTLTEALIAVGIMSIGLLALMTFFPLAAVQMARSFKDDRTGTLAANADNLFRTVWREMWYNPTTFGNLNQEPAVAQSESALQALDDPWVDYGAIAPDPAPGSLNPPTAGKYAGTPYLDGGGRNPPPNFNAWYGNKYPLLVRGNTTWPSFPVLIDPIGFRVRRAAAGTNPEQHWVGYDKAPGDSGTGQEYFLPRRTLRTLDATTPDKASRYCTLLDDITFAETGLPDTTSGAIDRAGKYNCAWLIQRSRNVTRLSIDITVLTFQGRPNSDVAGQERSAQIRDNTSIAGSTSLNVYYGGGGADLPVHRGEWIIVVNMSNPTDANFPLVPDSRRFLSFHRVQAITDNGNQTYTVDLQQPIPKMPAGVGLPTHIVMMEGLVEVFEAGTITLKTPPQP